MFAEVCVKYLDIAKAQVKLCLRVNILFSVVIMALVPVVCGIDNLDASSSSVVLERFVSFTGIVLLTPAFLPEQDKNIAEVAESKYTSHIKIYLIRFILSAVSLLLLVSGFIAVMILLSCEFDALKYIFGTFATAFFLGSLGFTAYAVSDNVVAGYLFPLGYYMFNMFSGRSLKNLYLFSLSGNSFTEKYWLLGIGAALIIAGILFRYILKKIR